MSRRRELTPVTDDTEGTTLADTARDHLATIRKGWRHVLDPITTTGGGATNRTERPATEDELELELPPDARLDTPLVLAFWVHAALDQWPTILQTLQPDDKGALRLVTTETIDCSDVVAMADLLHREAERITTWRKADHDYGPTFVAELAKISRAVARVAWPPPGDRITIGECPACGRRIRLKAPAWAQKRLPQPTTDPDAYPAWVLAEWEPARDAPITCRCDLEDTLVGWRERMAGPSLLLTAEQIVADVREQFGMRYQPNVLRQWSRRGMITTQGYSKQGHALYDRTQVLAALMAREKDRERAS